MTLPSRFAYLLNDPARKQEAETLSEIFYEFTEDISIRYNAEPDLFHAVKFIRMHPAFWHTDEETGTLVADYWPQSFWLDYDEERAQEEKRTGKWVIEGGGSVQTEPRFVKWENSFHPELSGYGDTYNEAVLDFAEKLERLYTVEGNDTNVSGDES